MFLKIIKSLTIFGIFIFPFTLFRKLAFPLSFSHVVFVFTLIELLFFLFIFYGLNKNQISFKKSYITLGLVIYIVTMFITALTGSEFGYSFWSNYSRMTGIITWLHYFSFFFIISSIFIKREDWENIFRALAVSGLFLAVFSFLGRDGFALQTFAFLKQGGSFLGNTSYSGAYLLLIFFISIIGFSFETNKKWKMVYIISMFFIFFNPDLFNFAIWNGGVSPKVFFTNITSFLGLARTSSLVLWSGLIMFLILFLFHKLKNKKIVVILATSLIVFLFLIYGYGFTSIIEGSGKLYNFYIEQSGIARPMVWDMAIRGIKERPILGYGDGNFKYVYQKYLNPEMIHIENPPWFDRAHNFLLEEIIGHGLLGASVMFGIFLLIIFNSFKLYLQEKRFFFLFIPFIFFLHFLQMQTFFQIDSTLFLSFLLLAFLVSSQNNISFEISGKYIYLYKIGITIIFIMTIIFFVYNPIKENRLILSIKNTPARSIRLSLQEGLNYLNIDPTETLDQNSSKFSYETVTKAQEIQEAGFLNNVGEEYKIYLNIYEKYYNRYSNYYRYLINYSNLINSAYIFNVDELNKGENLARKALEISRGYPYPYWVLAINLYYQGKNDEALFYVKQGYELDPTIEKSKEIYETFKNKVNSKSQQKSFFYLPDL